MTVHRRAPSRRRAPGTPAPSRPARPAGPAPFDRSDAGSAIRGASVGPTAPRLAGPKLAGTGSATRRMHGAAAERRPCTLATAFLLLLAALTSCSRTPSGTWHGYLEGEFVYVAAPLAGTLTQLAVSRGEEVKPGQLLFALDNTPEAAAEQEAQHRLLQSRARQANLQKGRRPSEIAALEAQLGRAEANLRLAELDLTRRRQLGREEVISAAELDAAQARADADRAQVATLKAELETARLGGREDEIQAATAEIEALEAVLKRARWTLQQKTQGAPTNGVVHDTLYRVGEWVAAGSPVVALLPPENIKVRFFVPETALAQVRLGQVVSIRRDGAPDALKATISYIATQAEFTPPVIYSRETRAKLVYLVEARFPSPLAPGLRPGQPVDVAPGN